MRKVSTTLLILYLVSLGAMVFFTLYPKETMLDIAIVICTIVGCFLVAAFLGFGMNDRSKEIRKLEQDYYDNLREINFIKRAVGILGDVKNGWNIDKSAYMPISVMCGEEFKKWEKYTRDLKNKLDSLGSLLGYTNILKTTAAKPETSEYVWEKKKELVKLVNKKK
jgi:hypothetical protein